MLDKGHQSKNGLLTVTMGHSATEKDVRDGGSFPRKRSPGAGDGCAADHYQLSLLLMAELVSIADAEVGDRGICNGPGTDIREICLPPV